MSNIEHYEETAELLEAPEEESATSSEARVRQIFDHDSNSIKFSNKRATDYKQNASIYLPKAVNIKRETEIGIRKAKLLEVAKEVRGEISERKASNSNLSRETREGLRSLQKRSKEGEIVIAETDKSGKFCVFSMEEYLKAGEVHTKNDVEIDEKDLKEIQRTLNATCSMFLKIFRVGEHSDYVERHRTNYINQSANPSAMKLLLKDHKGLEKVAKRRTNGPGYEHPYQQPSI